MSWNGTLITLEGARQVFNAYGLEFSHNKELDIYECSGFESGILQSQTLVKLCQLVVEEIAA